MFPTRKEDAIYQTGELVAYVENFVVDEDKKVFILMKSSKQKISIEVKSLSFKSGA